MYFCIYITVAELTNEKGRLMVYLSGWVTWVAGTVILSMIAWLTHEWYLYGVIVPLLNLAIIPFIWLTPESPRLLLTKRKVDKAFKIISNARKWNGCKDDPKELYEELQSISDAICEEKVYGVVTLFKAKRLAFYTLLLSIIWWVCTYKKASKKFISIFFLLFFSFRVVNDFLYIGGQLNVENLAGNQFINFAIVGLTELPSVFIGEFFMNRIGRRWSQVLCLTSTGIFYGIVVAALLGGVKGVAITVIAIFAKTTREITMIRKSLTYNSNCNDIFKSHANVYLFKA